MKAAPIAARNGLPHHAEMNVSVNNSENQPTPSPPDSPPPKSIWEVIDNPWVVLILLFFVMAILGLPVLWKSRGFSPLSKVVLSVVVTLYTALLFWLVGLLLWWCWSIVAPELGWS